MAEYEAACAERDLIEQMVADGELCGMDGRPCELETHYFRYGEDRDGNRGMWVEETVCRKCGEYPT